jgi:hypothetical protein
VIASTRNRWGIVLAGIVVILGLLVGTVAGYWQHVNHVPPYSPTLPPMPEPNGWDHAVSAVRQLSSRQAARVPGPPPGDGRGQILGNPPPVPPRWPEGTPEELRKHLSSRRPVLEEVRAAFRLEWRARPNLRITDRYPWLGEFRECARCFAAESNLARSRGDDETAFDRGLDAMELGSKVVGGADTLTWLTGVGCHTQGLAQAEQLVATLPGHAIPGALNRVRHIRQTWPELSEMIETERVTRLAQAADGFRREQQQPLRERFDPSNYLHASLWELLSLALAPRRNILSEMDRYYQRQFIESRNPVRHRTSVPMPDHLWAKLLIADLNDPWRYERMKTDLALLEVALAVRIHYVYNGYHPRRLADIDRRWLPQTPLDLWDQPVQYQSKGERPVIYSLGADGEDNGGQAVNPDQSGHPYEPRTSTRGDVVFGKLSRRSRQR